MFTITFKDVDRSLLKVNKQLRNKKGFTILEADQQLKLTIDKNVTGVLTIVLSEEENDLDYIFDNIKINETTPHISEILETEINLSGHENAYQLTNKLEKALEAEKLTANTRTQSKSTKKFSLFGGKKNKGSDKEIESKSVIDDFVELTDDSSLEPTLSDFEENKTAADFEEVSPELNDDIRVEDDFEEVQNNTSEESFEEPEAYDSHFSDVPFEDENSEVEDEGYSANEFDDDDENEIVEDFTPESDRVEKVSEKKHERILFPAYQEYMDLSSVDSTIKRFKDRFEKEHLVKFLGLNTLAAEKSISELEEQKLNYALNALDESEFVLISDYFLNSIEDIKDKTQTQLRQVYEKVMLFDFEEEANKNLNEDFESLLSESEDAFNQYDEEQQKEYQAKLEKFDFEQEQQLEDFKRKLALERSTYEIELDSKKSSRISVYKDDMQRNISNKKNELVDNKMHELKYQSISELTDAKLISIRNFEVQLDQAMDDVWGNLQNELGKLKEKIQTHIPTWKAEIKENEEIAAAKREEQREQDKLDIERTRIELHKRELDQKSVINEVDNKQIIDLQEKFDMFNRNIETVLTQGSNHQEDKQLENGQGQGQPVNTATATLNTYKKAFIGAGVVVLIGGGALLGRSFVTAETPVNNTPDPYEVLAASIDSLEEKYMSQTEIASNQVTAADNSEEEKEEQVSLNELLLDRKYKDAVKLYNDKESLNMIESAIFNDGDLDSLKSLNETNKTVYGELDEAILSSDSDKALKLYEGLSDDEQASITNDRRNEIAILLVKKGEKDLAAEILESDEK